MIFRSSAMNDAVRAAMILLLLIPLACGEGDGGREATAFQRHPLAEAVDGITTHLSALSADDAALIENFRKTATPSMASWDVRQVCAAVGRGLSTADSEVVADFVVKTREHLYADFFAAFDTGALERLAGSFRVTAEVPELTVLRIEVIVRRAQGAYSGTLGPAAAELPFADAMAPRPMPVEWLLPAEDAPAEVYSGAAAVLRNPFCVQGGARPDLAFKIYRQALDKWPEDPVFVAGMASLLIENEEQSPARVLEFLDEAHRRDPDNAAWLYLKAARCFRTGQDAAAFQALSSAEGRPHLSLHGVERANRIVRFLVALGYSPIRSRVVGCRLTSSAAGLDLKLVGSKALLRSYEYDDLESCRVLLELPLIIDRQLGDRPRMLITEQIRLSLLSSGLPRLADLSAGGPSAPDANVAPEAKRRLAAIERGERLCGGLEAWGRILSHTGEERFLRYLDDVLSGGEARFLEACAAKDRFEDCLSLLP